MSRRWSHPGARARSASRAGPVIRGVVPGVRLRLCLAGQGAAVGVAANGYLLDVIGGGGRRPVGDLSDGQAVLEGVVSGRTERDTSDYRGPSPSQGVEDEGLDRSGRGWLPRNSRSSAVACPWGRGVRDRALDLRPDLRARVQPLPQAAADPWRLIEEANEPRDEVGYGDRPRCGDPCDVRAASHWSSVRLGGPCHELAAHVLRRWSLCVAQPGAGQVHDLRRTTEPWGTRVTPGAGRPANPQGRC